MEIAVRSAHEHLVARFEGEDIARGDAGVDILEAHLGFRFERGSGDAHGEHEPISLGRIVGHGIGAYRGLGVDAFEAEKTEFFPCREIFRTDRSLVDIFVVVDAEGGNLYLGV